MRARSRLILVCAVLAIFFVQVGARLYTRVPWCDEGFFADPATSLLEDRTLGSRAADPNRVWITGDAKQRIHKYFYYLPPLYPVTLASWWAVVGPGVFAMRWLSVTFGLLLLWSTYSLSSNLTNNRDVAVLAAALLSVDYHFVTAAADGRMDCMMTALGFSGLAVYLKLQGQGRRTLALLASSTLLGLAILTHPNAVFYVPLLLMLLFRDQELYKDGAVQWQSLLFLVLPQLLLFGLWGVYIARDPQAFVTQFRTNLAYHPASHLLSGFLQELSRYDITFSPAPFSDHLRMFTTIPLIALAVVGWIKLRRLIVWPLILLSSMALMMTFLMGRKWSGYLINIIPLYSVVAAACVIYCQPRVTRSAIALYVVACLCFTANAVRLDRYHREFDPTIAFLKPRINAGTQVTGAAYLAFGIGFKQLHDDFTLGRRSGPLPDYIVQDEWYATLTDSLRGTHTGLYEHIEDTLQKAKPLFEAGQYRVYECPAECKNTVSSFQARSRPKVTVLVPGS